MAKETEQAAEEKTETNTEAQTAEETAEAQTAETEKEETVPKARFEEVMAERNAAEERVGFLTQQQQIINANQQKPAEQKPFDIYAHVGLDPDDPLDIPNQSQLKKIDEYNRSRIDSRLAQVQFLSTHPDFNEIVGTDEGIRAGRFAPPLAKAIKENPALLQTIISSPNMHDTAYQIAKLKIDNPDKKVETGDAKDAIDEAVENAQKVKSSSNVAGGGVLSEAGRYESMDDEPFIELARSHGAPI